MPYLYKDFKNVKNFSTAVTLLSYKARLHEQQFLVIHDKIAVFYMNVFTQSRSIKNNAVTNSTTISIVAKNLSFRSYGKFFFRVLELSVNAIKVFTIFAEF